MKIQLIALRDHVYGCRLRKAGTEYSTSYRHGAEVLIRLGHADFAPARAADLQPATAVEIQPAGDADMPRGYGDTTEAAIDAPAPICAAEEASAHEDEPAPPPAEISPRTGLPKRQYRRRDLTAEG